MTIRFAPRAATTRVRLFLLLLSVLVPLAARPAIAAPPAAPPAAPLEPLAPPEPRAPLPTAASGLRLDLPANTYLRFVVTPGFDALMVRQLRADDGSPVAERELQDTPDAPAHISWLVAAAGSYVFTVDLRAASGRSPTGGVAAPAGASPADAQTAYALAIEEQRPADACDSERLAGERAAAAATLQLTQPGGDAAVAQDHAARALGWAAAVGESLRLASAHLVAGRAAARRRAPGAAADYEQAASAAAAAGDLRTQALAIEALGRLDPARAGDAARAAEIYRQLGDRVALSQSRQWRGFGRASAGDAAGAAAEYQLALAAEWSTGDVPGQMWTLQQLGRLAGAQGDAPRALAYLELAFERAGVRGDRAGQVAALREQALLATDFGELQTAADDYGRAYALLAGAVAPGDVAEAAWCRDGRAMTYLYLGEPGRAQGDLAAALQAFDALHLAEGMAHAHLGLGAVAQALGRPDDALAEFARALELIEARGLLHMRGMALYLLGGAHVTAMPVQAIAELEDALRAEDPDSRAHRPQVEVELARALEHAGRAAAAEEAYRRALELAAHAPLVQAAAQAGLARCESARGELRQARAAIERAVQITETVRAGVLRPDLRVSFLAARREYYELWVALLMRLAASEPSAGHAAEAIGASEQARARGLLDLLARQQVDVGRIVPADLAARQHELSDRIAALQSRLLGPAEASLTLGANRPERDAAATARLESELAAAEEQERDLAAEVERRRPAYAEVQPPHPLPLADMQRLLDERTAFAEYLVGTDASYLFVVTLEGVHAHTLPPRRELEGLVARFNAAVHQDSRLRGRSFAADASQLYRWLLQPAAAELAGKPRLIIAPDGPLYTLTFAALLTHDVPDAAGPRRDLPYLIRERTLSYVPSASVLAHLLAAARLEPSTPAAGGLAPLFVAFGDPLAPPAASPGAPPRAPDLPAARGEVMRIAQLFPPHRAAVFLGAEASEENVKRSPLVAAARNLHFATHGLLDERQPEHSGLQLARGAGDREDGLLQVREVFNLELHADLVVLSACRTGLGQEVSGEGLIGMTRAFLFAGAASVGVSLWPVDDESTADLMVRFYGHLLRAATPDKAEALRQAELDLLDQSNYSQPFYWGSFILIGRPL